MRKRKIKQSSEDYDCEMSMLTDKSEENKEKEDNEKQTKDIKDQVDTSSGMVTDEDHDDDKDFNEKDEDDDADNYNVVTQAKEITKEKADKDTDKNFRRVRFHMSSEEEKRCMERWIVVENISPRLDMVASIKLFSQYGNVEAFGRPSGTTKIEDAVRALHGMKYHGNFLSIQMSTRYEGPYNPKKKLYSIRFSTSTVFIRQVGENLLNVKKMLRNKKAAER
ncbi:PREDICTED: uncharacterized protein LOC105559434 [Vollenhovia emeryi]|uniref:uncharacterized protein LOC105559434 n=1 Tax=Vollenhovia emeryi TaxID=411798 RepID=UPI0005F42521|nr:PREDICTED: uncharacterized protein LOC105559434 [Vollenhovia emeryi]